LLPLNAHRLLLQEYALALRARNRDAEAEPVLRRALSIQQSSPKADPQVTIGVLNTLGNLLEGRCQFEQAEKLERSALALSEEKMGPESVQLAMTCTDLADVLWDEKNLRAAGLLYRRAIAIDISAVSQKLIQRALVGWSECASGSRHCFEGDTFGAK
jgi:tetratricopeptide (TPR) repeat protein